MNVKTDRAGARRGIAFASAMLLAVATGLPAMAQSATHQPTLVQQADENVQFAEAKLEAFVDVFVKIEGVKQAWLPQIKAAESDEERAKIMERAQAQVLAAVESVPEISIEEYNTVARTTQKDDELRGRLEAILKRRLKDAGGGESQ